MLLCDNIFHKLEHLHSTAQHEHLIHRVALLFASSFPLIIPHASYLGCYFLSDNYMQQLTYPCNSCCRKTNTLLFLFQFFSFVGNSLCRVRRKFGTFFLYPLNQSFVMTIIEFIIATFVIKCIISCQCLYDSRAIIDPG